MLLIFNRSIFQTCTTQNQVTHIAHPASAGKPFFANGLDSTSTVTNNINWCIANDP